MTEIDYQVFDQGNSKVAIRAWEPGDGLSCSSSRGFSRIPCGPPVAVVITKTYANRPDLRGRTIRRVACAHHLPGIAKPPHQISVEAGKAAQERIIAEHWDDYQAALAEELNRRLGEMYEGIDEPIRRLIVDAMQRNSEAGGQS
ncbi:hypothetical protein OG216_09915 [Streptomycetaceae bacterium NBC_01309]